MKKKLATILLLTFTVTSLVACGNSSSVAESTADTTIEAEVAITETTVTPEPTEAPHEHAYVETITTEATCETDGVKTFTCECGDTYTETITATGHVFENYTSNNDATYLADGTETAKCSNCDVTDTRTAEGSMLTYTYTDNDATMYVQKSVNVRSMPNTDGEKLGSLSTNEEVKVTGQCVETSWYRIEYSGGVAYVSDSYLGNDKVVIEQPKEEQTTQNKSTTNSNVVISAGGYTVIEKNGYAVLDGPAPTSFDEACAIARALGYDVYQIHDGSWFYGVCGDGATGSSDIGFRAGWSVVAEHKDLDVPGGYINLGNWYYITRWRNS